MKYRLGYLTPDDKHGHTGWISERGRVVSVLRRCKELIPHNCYFIEIRWEKESNAKIVIKQSLIKERSYKYYVSRDGAGKIKTGNC